MVVVASDRWSSRLRKGHEPLASVTRIVEKGIMFVLGGDNGQSYIEGVNGTRVSLNETERICTPSVEYLQEMISEIFARPA